MLPVLTAAQMRAADRHTIEVLGVKGERLMEAAGSAVARLVADEFPDARPAVLCGKGNNGGDGFVAARRLLGRRPLSRRPLVLLFGHEADVKGDARTHLFKLKTSGGEVREVADLAAWEAVRADVLACGVLIDALLGTGLRAAPAGLLGRVIADLAAAYPNKFMWGSDSPYYSYAAEINHEVVRLISTYGQEVAALKANPSDVVFRIACVNTLKYLQLPDESILS